MSVFIGHVHGSIHPFLFVLFGLLLIICVIFFILWWLECGFGIENIVSGILCIIFTLAIIWTSFSLKKYTKKEKKRKAENFEIYHSESTISGEIDIKKGLLKYAMNDEHSPYTLYKFFVDGQQKEISCFFYGKYKRNHVYYILSLKYFFENGKTQYETFAFNPDQYVLDKTDLGIQLQQI